MWVARRQAQNSADAAALAGAISLAYGDPTDLTCARLAAGAAGRPTPSGARRPTSTVNDVASAVPGRHRRGDPTCACGWTSTATRSAATRCPRCSRAGGRDQPRRESDGHRAGAIGNNATCVKPWVISDKWIERSTPTTRLGTPTWTFDDLRALFENGPIAATFPGPAGLYHAALTNLQGPYCNNSRLDVGSRVPGSAGCRHARHHEVGNPSQALIGRLVLPA